FHPSACDHSLFLSRLLLPPPASLFPYTTLFRSSGTPTSARPAFTYSIAASNVYGSSVGATLLLTVDPPPAGTAVPAGGGSTVSKDRKSTRLNSSHQIISYAVFCLKKKTKKVHNL